MTEYENEPIPGLPGIPPAGEQILWQGSPDWRVLARTAFHTRLVAAYFVLLTAWALISALAQGVGGPGDLLGAGMTALVGVIGVGLLHLLAWGSARTTIYTLTNRRIVLRIGMALPKCINLPLALVGAVDLAARADGSGDMPLTIRGQQKLGYLALWPHARPWKLARPQPMLRAIPKAADVAALIARTCLAANPEGRIAAARPSAAPIESFGEAVAA
ncbi:photosynthetic complex putative assembly protein PuhB [Sphingomonas sp. M1-B02]|uniref:photosynthetic complex putative assembly protein PuhB n=1 Tax=Sphingomonas sp. M1-B02 TaxID=3114300 RepID=UPI00224009A5|nr:photosynthetic complex putative assembly protein PuhB [Sphingomonas sp. S6-11]UZK66643.1 photosynthetic complex putative assembly protein PuhB [Sphingomonas sp. S6-11]